MEVTLLYFLTSRVSNLSLYFIVLEKKLKMYTGISYYQLHKEAKDKSSLEKDSKLTNTNLPC